jgi:hypothetical protein
LAFGLSSLNTSTSRCTAAGSRSCTPLATTWLGTRYHTWPLRPCPLPQACPGAAQIRARVPRPYWPKQGPKRRPPWASSFTPPSAPLVAELLLPRPHLRRRYPGHLIAETHSLTPKGGSTRRYRPGCLRPAEAPPARRLAPAAVRGPQNQRSCTPDPQIATKKKRHARSPTRCKIRRQVPRSQPARALRQRGRQSAPTQTKSDTEV